MPEWVFVDEAASLTGNNAERVLRLIRQGQIIAKKKGGRWWIDQTSVLAYGESGLESDDTRRGPNSPAGTDGLARRQAHRILIWAYLRTSGAVSPQIATQIRLVFAK